MGKFVGSPWGSAKTTAETQAALTLFEDAIRLCALCGDDVAPETLVDFTNNHQSPDYIDMSEYIANNKKLVMYDLLRSYKGFYDHDDPVATARAHFAKKFFEFALDMQTNQPSIVQSFANSVLGHSWFECEDGQHIDLALNSGGIDQYDLVVLLDKHGDLIDPNNAPGLANFAVVIPSFWLYFDLNYDTDCIRDILREHPIHFLVSTSGLVAAQSGEITLHGVPYIKVIEDAVALSEFLVQGTENQVSKYIPQINGVLASDRALALANCYTLNHFFRNDLAHATPESFPLPARRDSWTGRNYLTRDDVKTILNLLNIQVSVGSTLKVTEQYVDDAPVIFYDEIGPYVYWSKSGGFDQYNSVINVDRVRADAPIEKLDVGYQILLRYLQNYFDANTRFGDHDLEDIAAWNDVDVSKYQDFDQAAYGVYLSVIKTCETSGTAHYKKIESLITMNVGGTNRTVPINTLECFFKIRGRGFVDAISSLPYTMEGGAATKGGVGGMFFKILQKCIKTEMMWNYSPRLGAETGNEVDALRTIDISGYVDGHIYVKRGSSSDQVEYISGRDWIATSRSGVTRFTPYKLIVVDEEGIPSEVYGHDVFVADGQLYCYGRAHRPKYTPCEVSITLEHRFCSDLEVNVTNNNEWLCLSMVDPDIDLVNRKSIKREGEQQDDLFNNTAYWQHPAALSDGKR